MKLTNRKKNRCTGHCTHTTESANVKVQNLFYGMTCSTNCKYRIAATLCTQET